MWLHYNAPHEPYEQHEGFHFGDNPIDRYDSEIASDDSHVGTLLDTLRDLGHENDTIVVLTADHGEEFGDHGGRSHGMKLYRELLNVPLLLKIPGVAPRVIDTPVELVDLAPTFCELLKAKGSCHRYDGQSLLVALADRREPTRGAYSELFHGPGRALRRALFDGRWRLVDDIERDRRELYDHERDPSEHYDVSQWHPEIVSQMMERIAVRPLLRRAPSSP
jgi:arylsulfatase A-like enzyme